MVKKELIVILAILTLFLAACSAPETTTDDQDIITVEPKSQDIKIGIEDNGDITVKQTTTPTTQKTSAEAQAILDAHSKIKSVRYIKDEGINPQFFYVKGEKYKKEISKPSRYDDPSENYDMVYVHRDDKNAYAYCEDLSSIACPLAERSNAYELSFEQQDEFLPLDLIPTIQYAEIIGREDIDSRHVNILEFINTDGQKGKVWMDSYHGFVFQYQLFDENDQVIEEHTYTRAAFNSLKDADVNLPEGVSIK